MERSNILAKNPGKIPELAYVNIICTDKTGTLTTGMMTPKKVISGNGEEVNRDSSLWNQIKENICLNNSAVFDSNNMITGGNSIDRAILSLVDWEQYEEIHNRIRQKVKQVFNSSNKYSAFTTNEGITYYKGAPEKLVDKCADFMDGDMVKPITDDVRASIYGNIKNMTTNAMRCIALTVKMQDLVENELPNNMTLLGVVGVVDPVRAEVPDAVWTAQQAGIQVIEITGDCIETAIAVAKECGIYHDEMCIRDS